MRAREIEQLEKRNSQGMIESMTAARAGWRLEKRRGQRIYVAREAKWLEKLDG
jgi:hypothetical protein